jgi:hypothetical protein
LFDRSQSCLAHYDVVPVIVTPQVALLESRAHDHVDDGYEEEVKRANEGMQYDNQLVYIDALGE